MSHSLHFWLRLSLLFLGLWGCIWLASIVWRKRREEGLTKPIIRWLNWTKIFQHSQNLCRIGMGVLIGMAVLDLYQYHHTFVLWDLTVMAEPGDIIHSDSKVIVVPRNTFYFQRASGPVGQMFPRTFCDKFVPGLHDGYHVEIIAATAEHYPIDCWNVAPDPLGIVYTQGGQ